MKLFYTALIVFCFFNNSHSQVRFQKIIGGASISIDSSSCIQLTTDGGYIITGTTNSFGSGQRDVYLIKTDANGDTLWTKTYGELGSWNEVGLFVQQTMDSGFIITGYTDISAPSRNTSLIKTDASGNLVWAKSFGSLSGGYSEGKCVQQTSDSGYIITGYIEDTSSSNGTGIFLLKTDLNGTLQWKKILLDGSGNEDGLSLSITTDGGYIITGYTYSYGAGGSDVCLIKTDNTGNIVWTKTFGGINDETGNSVQQTTEGGYIIAGKTESFGSGGSDVYLIKTDSNGNALWTKTYGGTSGEFGYSVKQTIDLGYIIVGSTYGFGAGSYDIYLVKTDSVGVISWSRTFGTVGYEYGYSVQQTTDNGYILVGTMYVFNPDIYLIKTDQNGYSGCDETDPFPPSTSSLVVSISTSLSIVSLTQTGTTVSSFPLMGNGGTATTSCFSTGINEKTDEIMFNIYPNPATNQITVEFDLANEETVLFEIRNVLGQVIYSETLKSTSSKKAKKIDVSGLSNGVYFVRLQSEIENISKKFIKN